MKPHFKKGSGGLEFCGFRRGTERVRFDDEHVARAAVVNAFGSFKSFSELSRFPAWAVRTAFKSYVLDCDAQVTKVREAVGLPCFSSVLSMQVTDWHAADVKAALEKRHLSLRRLAAQHGYSHIQRALYVPWIGAEKIIADALDMQPEEIWPSRYLVPRDHARKLTRVVALPKPKSTRPLVKAAKPAKPAKPKA